MNPDTGEITKLQAINDIIARESPQNREERRHPVEFGKLIPLGATRPDDTQEKTDEAAKVRDEANVLKIIEEWASIGDQRNAFTLHKKLNLIFALLTIKYQI